MTHGPSECPSPLATNGKWLDAIYIYILRSAYETSYDPTRTQQVPTRLNMSFISCVMMSPIQHQHIGTLMSQTHLDETTRIPVFDITDKRTL